MLNSEPFFSVIMPAYNRAHTIGDSIESILAQSFDDFEIIAVDDGSSDNTIEVLCNYSQVKVLTQRNRGPGAARNLAAKSATGRFIAFLDSDDLWLPWTLEHFRQVILNENALFVSGAGIEFTCELPNPQNIDAPLNYSVYRDYFEGGASGLWIGTCGVAIDRELFARVGGFVETPINSEDSDLWMKLGVASPFVRINEPTAFCYRRSDTSATSDIDKTNAGAKHLIESEYSGNYPGGINRQSHRYLILGRHLRPVCIANLSKFRFRDAASIYFRSFRINLRTLRFKFLTGTPLLGAYRFVNRLLSTRKST
jgi:glycosyltransferase involved in cell wall biosynthesis